MFGVDNYRKKKRKGLLHKIWVEEVDEVNNSKPTNNGVQEDGTK